MMGYVKEDFENLKYKFLKAESIKNNYSQAFQDMFVLSMLDGKRNGFYVEVGGDHPSTINNTYLLETEFDWKGISFEIREESVNFYNESRKNKCLCADATKVDYSKVFEENNFPNQIDYLQLDIEPAHQTLAALKQLDLKKYRFYIETPNNYYFYNLSLQLSCDKPGNDFQLIRFGYRLTEILEKLDRNYKIGIN